LSVCPFSFGHCLVCLSFLFQPLSCLFVLSLSAIVLYVCPFSFSHCLVCLSFLFQPLSCLFFLDWWLLIYLDIRKLFFYDTMLTITIHAFNQ
jgi:hypothetical protein